MSFIKALNKNELISGTMKKVTLNGIDVLIANVEGTFYGISNKCPHMGGSLAKGQLEGNTVKCPIHGSKFSIITGENIGDAKILFIKQKVKNAKVFKVKLEGEEVFVDVD
jgi:3-phenylpropionate/trans-cinnamate dioxygenase ferredoxin subunit